MAALRGKRLWRIPVDRRDAGQPEAYFVGDYGRMRTVVVAPDGNLWVTTSNRDGRGRPSDDDDQILVVQPDGRLTVLGCAGRRWLQQPLSPWTEDGQPPLAGDGGCSAAAPGVAVGSPCPPPLRRGRRGGAW